MLFPFFLLACSAVIIFKQKEHRYWSITSCLTLLNGTELDQLDLSHLTFEDLKFIPADFVAIASKHHLEKILSLDISGLTSEAKEAVSWRQQSEKPSDTLEDHVERLYELPFTEVPTPKKTSPRGPAGGPILILKSDQPFKSLYKMGLNNKLIESKDIKPNDLRKRAWNYLQKKFRAPKLDESALQILSEWAHISFIFAAGLKVDSSPWKLIKFFEKVHFFSSQGKEDWMTWVNALEKCKKSNLPLWESMSTIAMYRFSEDPDYNVPVPPSKPKAPSLAIPKANRTWIPALDREMKEIMQIKGTEMSRMPAIKEPRVSVSYSAPFLMQDPPQIAPLFEAKTILYENTLVEGRYFRRHLARQLRILQGKVKITLEYQRLITEWSMITLIFHGSNLPRRHSPYVNRLLEIPIDFAKAEQSRKRSYHLTLEESAELIKQGRDANPKLWDALVKVAAGRLRADPQLKDLPLLDALSLREVADLLVTIEKLLSQPVLDRGAVRTVFAELKASLEQRPEQIPHGLLVAKEMGKFI